MIRPTQSGHNLWLKYENVIMKARIVCFAALAERSNKAVSYYRRARYAFTNDGAGAAKCAKTQLGGLPFKLNAIA